jgi:hypothetical protein
MNNNYIGVDLDLFRQPEIQRLDIKLGKGAIAIYLQICFKLAEQDGQILVSDIPILSREFFVKEDLIKEVLDFDGLFKITDNYFSCEWVTIRVLASKEKSSKARKSILSRWKHNKGNTSEDTNVLQPNNESNTINKKKQNKTKQNKNTINEINKENIKEILDFYNSTFNKNLISSVSWEDNASIWLETYTMELIQKAIVNLDHPSWWANKPKDGEKPNLPTLDFLFRTRNKNGKVDYISELLTLDDKPKPINTEYEYLAIN